MLQSIPETFPIFRKCASFQDSDRRTVARIACMAALGSKDLSCIADYVPYLAAKDPNLYFFRSIMAFEAGQS